MTPPTCCCSVSLDRCDRCDLLVGLEGLHLMSVARTSQALVLDIESCNQLAGCSGCGVIARGRGRVVVEVIDAPWAGVPVRIRWYKRRLTCREGTRQTVTFLEHDERVCAPRARLGVRAIRWAIRQLRFEGATIAGLARQLETTWNTDRSHQRNHRTRQTHCQRLSQPHQLQTPNAPHRRRPRRLHPHSTLKIP